MKTICVQRDYGCDEYSEVEDVVRYKGDMNWPLILDWVRVLRRTWERLDKPIQQPLFAAWLEREYPELFEVAEFGVVML
jgi:hypothetical protein